MMLSQITMKTPLCTNDLKANKGVEPGPHNLKGIIYMH